MLKAINEWEDSGFLPEKQKNVMKSLINDKAKNVQVSVIYLVTLEKL